MQRAFTVLLADATISESALNLSSGVLLMACDMVLHLSGKSFGMCVNFCVFYSKLTFQQNQLGFNAHIYPS